MSPLHALEAETSKDRWVPVGRTVAILVAAFVLWATFAHLDEVAVAAGEVVPQGQVKTIQHLEGGIIDEIFVREGDTVREGTPLVQLDLAGSTNNKEELQVRLDNLILTRTRLEAEATGSKPTFPKDITARQPQMTAAQLAAFNARAQELASSHAVLQGQVTQRDRDMREVQVRLDAAEESLSLAQERLGMSSNLLKDKLQAPMDHLEIERDVAGLKGDVASLQEALPRARAALAEARERTSELKFKYRREAREMSGDTEADIARINEMMVRAIDQQTRTTIRSPTNGVVKNMRYNTLGGVVRPGEPIMDIVPTEDTLVIEARLNPIDRGFVRAGQRAVVKIDTYDFARYGGLDGEVQSVAPDSTVPERSAPYFKVVIQTDRPWLGDEADNRLITPGMGATVDIHTGTRTVLEYLLRPVLKMKSEAFRER
jgi:adhesin transport system membrane fusion protein